MKKSIYLCFAIISIGCSSESETDNPFENLTYYAFTEEDQNKLLLDHEVNQSVKYVSQGNAEITFEVKAYSKKKSTYGSGTFWGNSSVDYFYYDKQNVVMSLSELPYLSNQLEIEHKRFPVAFNENNIPHERVYSTLRSTLKFPFWNGLNENDIITNFDIQVNFALPKISMTFNGYNFNDVIVIESNSNQIINPQATYPRNVNVLFYDVKFGVIGFDDIDGNSWRLQ